MAHVKVEVPVVVEIGPCRRSRPITIAAELGRNGHVFEPALAAVVVEGVGTPSRDEEIRPAVIIVVPHGDSVAVSTGQLGQAGGDRRVFESAVALGCARGGRQTAHGSGRVGETFPPVRHRCRASRHRRNRARHAATHGLGELTEFAAPVVKGEDDAPGWRRRRRTWLGSAQGGPLPCLFPENEPAPRGRREFHRPRAAWARPSPAVTARPWLLAQEIDLARPRSATTLRRQTAYRLIRRRGRA